MVSCVTCPASYSVRRVSLLLWYSLSAFPHPSYCVGGGPVRPPVTVWLRRSRRYSHSGFHGPGCPWTAVNVPGGCSVCLPFLAYRRHPAELALPCHVSSARTVRNATICPRSSTPYAVVASCNPCRKFTADYHSVPRRLNTGTRCLRRQLSATLIIISACFAAARPVRRTLTAAGCYSHSAPSFRPALPSPPSPSPDAMCRLYFPDLAAARVRLPCQPPAGARRRVIAARHMPPVRLPSPSITNSFQPALRLSQAALRRPAAPSVTATC
ncbi:hypothetical protein KCP73_01515 [Salmonella enterica subsp. enterica]|nr:hypothetical protein KCP73_01515 [Salmonella enterica subsp. enterica]